MKKQINSSLRSLLIRGACYLLLLLTIVLMPLALAQRTTANGKRPASTIMVTNLNDSGPGSLRQALADANDGDTINFAVNGTIALTSGELAIDKSVTISGETTSITVSGGLNFRVFHVMPGHNVTIEYLQITRGDDVYGGGVLNDHANLTISNCSLTTNDSTYGYGGAIYNDGSEAGATLTVLNSSILGNHAAQAAGGIYNHASNGSTAIVSLINCTVNNNTAAYTDNHQIAEGNGGAIYNSGGMVTISDSSVSNNSAGVTDPYPIGTGGAIYSSGTLTITNSTISGNRSYLAGGGIAGGTLTITNSTISGNITSSQHDGQLYGRGGGIYADGGLQIRNSTVSGNSAAVHGGSIYGSFDIGDTILNSGIPENIFSDGSVTSHGYNVSSDNGGGYLTGPGDQINTDPMLGPLQDNGGPTFTHALLPGSPAIDAGDPKFTPPPYYDQRGPTYWRVRNGRIDVGSFEVQTGASTATPTPTASPTPTPTPTATFTPTATTTATATATFTLTPTPTTTAIATPTPRYTPVPRPRPTAPPRP